MTNIYLVRHAQYANPDNIIPGRLPVELSEDGIQEAKRLREFFADKNISHIYTSPVYRCSQTSEIIAAGELTVSNDKRLAETLSPLQGSKRKGPHYPNLYEYISQLGGESPEDIQGRMADFWNTINFEDNKNYIICSHGDPLLFLFQYLQQEVSNSDSESSQAESYQSKGSVRLVQINNGQMSLGAYKTNNEL